MKFRELTDINENILKAIDAMGFGEMTQIQEQIVPIAVRPSATPLHHLLT